MLEAQIAKTVVVQDQKTGKSVLMGVAEYYGEKVNFKVVYDWDTLDIEWFTKELKESLAKDFDIPPYRVNICERDLLQKMRQYSEWMKNQ